MEPIQAGVPAIVGMLRDAFSPRVALVCATLLLAAAAWFYWAIRTKAEDSETERVRIVQTAEADRAKDARTAEIQRAALECRTKVAAAAIEHGILPTRKSVRREHDDASDQLLLSQLTAALIATCLTESLAPRAAPRQLPRW